MGIAKNFVVKNGLEVNSDLLVANADTSKVGIASTGPRTTLDVRGGIAATDLNVSGVATITRLQSVTGIITNGHFGNVKVSGITTAGVFAPTDVRALNINATGVGTFAVGIVSSLNGDNINYSGIGSIGGFLFSSGIVTSTALGAGIVTYYGDGGNLSNLPTASPGGSNFDVQFNATSGGVGVFTGDSGFTFNYETLTVPSINVSAAATIAGITTADATGINVTGVITATSFSGNGAGLTGVASTDNIQTATDATFLANVSISGITTVASTLNVGTAVTANSTGINVTGVITATSFSGDGSGLSGISGFSTSLSSTQGSFLSEVFVTQKSFKIESGIHTISATDSQGKITFTKLNNIHLGVGATIVVSAGTTFIMNILGVFSE